GGRRIRRGEIAHDHGLAALLLGEIELARHFALGRIRCGVCGAGRHHQHRTAHKAGLRQGHRDCSVGNSLSNRFPPSPFLANSCDSGEPSPRRGVPITFRIRNFDMGTILVIVLLLLLLGAWPAWPYSRSWGYYPSGTLGLVLVIV